MDVPQEPTSPICEACKSITFEDLCRGFDHPLSYQEAIMSARTCKLCRLMVCSFSRLQVEQNPYEVNDNYDRFIERLLERPVVTRQAHFIGMAAVAETEYPITEHFCRRPEHLSWEVLPNMSNPGEVHGCFNDGACIRLSAPEGSKYLAKDIIVSREIYEANCERNNSLIYTWLYDCIDYHTKCNISVNGSVYDDPCGTSTVLPTRIIDVGPPDGSTAARLVVTTGKKGAYLVLSHRWGNSQKVITTNSNFSKFQQCLPIEQLPKTFLDAITVTRRLAVRYLWIDSLCIIQDDNDDWEREAKQMGSIFEGAICTIAAIDAIDDERGQDQGLFIPRNTDPLAVRLDCAYSHEEELPPEPSDSYYVLEDTGIYQSQLLPFSQPATHKEIVLRLRWKGLFHTILDTAWNTRGWILQERLLSRRLIYYTKRKVFWECNMLSSDEENIVNEKSSLKAYFAEGLSELAGLLQRNESPVAEHFRFWWHTIEDYTRCKLTKAEDKLAALAGLCERVESRIGKPIYAGIMNDPSGLNLLWRATNQIEQREEKFHAPSWSWASCNGAVIYSTIDPVLKHVEILRTVRNIHFDMLPDCIKIKSTKTLKCPKGSCCGVLSFTAPTAVAYASEKLDATGWQSNPELIPVLGSSIHMEQIPVPRKDAHGVLDTPKRHLSLPRQTRVLRDQSDSVIGWLVPDEESLINNSRKPLICAAISQQIATGRPTKRLINEVVGYDYSEEEIVDILALEEIDRIDSNQQARFIRVGRGRIVKRSWLLICKETYLTIQ